jgi:phage baseplate assembly protein W
VTQAQDFIIRTEDIKPEAILDLFVPIQRDRELVQKLKSTSPIIIEGSRGTGKSLLLRVCEQEQLQTLAVDRVLPVYVSFARSSLLNTNDPQQFQHWMLASLCSRIIRAIAQAGLAASPTEAVRALSGGSLEKPGEKTKLEILAEQFEQSYKNNNIQIDPTAVPTVELFRDAVEDICNALKLSRFNVLFDEAAHIFRPEQQMQFFTLFRDLRSPYMTCNAAVYPGVTAYGDSFESTHDAQMQSLHRDVTSPDYVSQMREIVFKQAESALQEAILKNGNTFAALTYAVSGNPRILLKTITLAQSISSREIESVIKEYFRDAIWAEHSGLAERYPGHKGLIDWGRMFVERHIIPNMLERNEAWKNEGKTERTAFFWIHRDAPEAVKEGLRLLMYTGIITRLDSGIVATRSEIGTRYSANIGCLASPTSSPIAFISDLRSGLTIKRYTEYGANYETFSEIAELVGDKIEADIVAILGGLLQRPVTVLDITEHQKNALASINIKTLGEALASTENDFMKADYIGPKRSRRIMNVVTSAVIEYLSG